MVCEDVHPHGDMAKQRERVGIDIVEVLEVGRSRLFGRMMKDMQRQNDGQFFSIGI